MNNRKTLLAGLVLAALASAPAFAVTHVIRQVDFTWSPDFVVINVGDTVRWEWSSLSHTVTNGTSLSDPAVGTMFDASLSSLSPAFSYTFTTPGTVPYFCRPHLLFGMTGTVVVQDVSAVGTPPTHGRLALAGAPNPFNPRTVISYALPEPATVRLAVYDVAGKQVRLLAGGLALDAGRHEAAWDGIGDDGHALPAGAYIVVAEAAGMRDAVKVTLVK